MKKRLRFRGRRPRPPWFIDGRKLFALRIGRFREQFEPMRSTSPNFTGDVAALRGVMFFRYTKRPEEYKRPRDKKRARLKIIERTTAEYMTQHPDLFSAEDIAEFRRRLRGPFMTHEEHVRLLDDVATRPVR